MRRRVLAHTGLRPFAPAPAQAPVREAGEEPAIVAGELRLYVLGHRVSRAEASSSRARNNRLMIVPVRVFSALAASL